MVRVPRLPGLRLLVVVAVIGLLLLYLPAAILRQYQAAQSLGPIWGQVYLAAVGIGCLLLMAASGWVLWRLWRSTARKRKRRADQARNPSQMSPAERAQEVADNLAAVTELRDDPSVSKDDAG